MNNLLTFKGGKKTALIPVGIFLFFCILYFIIFKAFEMYALGMGAFLALLFLLTLLEELIVSN